MYTFNVKDSFLNNDSDGINIKFYKNEKFYKTSYKDIDEVINEKIVSDFLKTTNLNEDEFVSYNLETHRLKTLEGGIQEKVFAVSKNFLRSGEEFISLNKFLYLRNINPDLYLYRLQYDRKIDEIVHFLGNNYNINISEYLSKIFLLDGIILNRDRHLRNLGVINYKCEYFTAPIFDNGTSLDRNKNYSKPFYNSHEEQIHFSQKFFKYKMIIYSHEYEEFLYLYRNDKINRRKIDIIDNNIDKYINYIDFI